MSNERDQAETLDGIIDGVLEQGAGVDALSGGSGRSDIVPSLDPTSLVRELHAVAESTPMRAEFMSDLEAQLLGATTETPANALQVDLGSRQPEGAPLTQTGTPHSPSGSRGWWDQWPRAHINRNNLQLARYGQQIPTGSRWAARDLGLAGAMIILLALAGAALVLVRPPSFVASPVQPSSTPDGINMSDLDALARKADVIAQVRVFLYNQDGQDATLGIEVQQRLKNGTGISTSTRTLFLRVPPQLWDQMPASFKSTQDPAGNSGKNDTYVMFLNKGPSDPTYGDLYYLTGGPQGAFLVLGGKIVETAFPQYKGMPAVNFERLITGESTPVPTIPAQDTPTRVPGSPPISLAREGDGFRLDVYEGTARFDLGYNLSSPWIGPSRLLVEWYSAPVTPTNVYTSSTYMLDTANGQLTMLPSGQPGRGMSQSPDGNRAIMLWQNTTMHVSLYDFSSGTLQTVADLDQNVPQWAGPDANLSQFKPGTEIFVNAVPMWAGNDSFALTVQHRSGAGSQADFDRPLLVDITRRQVRVLANEGTVTATFPDGSVLFRSGRIDGAMQLYRAGDKSVTPVGPSGLWTAGWSTSPDGKQVAWFEMTPPAAGGPGTPPVECCSSEQPPALKDIAVFDSATGQIRRFDVSGLALTGPGTSWTSSDNLRWGKDSATLFYSTHPTKNHAILYRLPLNGRPAALVDMDKPVGLDVVAEGNDGSIYYTIIGQAYQNYVQLMHRHLDGTVEVVHANSASMFWQVDGHGRLEEFKDDGVRVTDLATGQSHQVNFPGEKADDGQVGFSSIGALVPISPVGSWAAYAGSESDAIGIAPDGRPIDRGRTVRVVKIR